jgi:3-oxosteroid 1-dehydrogenase
MTTGDRFAPRESAAPVRSAELDAPFDASYDIVVVGGGGGGLPTALFSRWLGNDAYRAANAAHREPVKNPDR